MSDSEPANILVVAAHPLELVPIEAVLRTHQAALASLRVSTCSVGVGLARAGGETARQLARRAADCVLLVGSCGAYPGCSPGLSLLDVVVPSELRLCDGHVCDGQAALPEPMRSRLPLDGALIDGLLRSHPAGRTGRIATTLGITTDDGLAERLATATQCDGENLEAFAIAESCEGAGVPCAALLSVTNQVGSEGRKQWLTHCHAAAAAISQALLQWLLAGAPGAVACKDGT